MSIWFLLIVLRCVGARPAGDPAELFSTASPSLNSHDNPPPYHASPGNAPKAIRPTNGAELDHVYSSPKTTNSPENRQLGSLELLRKQDPGENTCGYVNGIFTSLLTCFDPDYVCATNSYYSIHGCCDPSSLSDCMLATSCVPKASVTLCTDSCTPDPYVATCTDSALPNCYEWIYVYNAGTEMTEHGCAVSAFTSSVSRTYNGESSILTNASEPGIIITRRTSVETSLPPSTGGVTLTEATSSVVGTANPSPTANPTGNTFPTDFSRGGVVGVVVGSVSVLALVIWWRWPKALSCAKKRPSDTAPATDADEKKVDEITPVSRKDNPEISTISSAPNRANLGRAATLPARI
ncbi:uncharacterized protein BDZ99DRAFT_494538 [Mytilinidion resinicola]|uniref:Mid2 domain-containing protein n=1 Tax=Mytilinidion resinicola TaxID=574789 RepID=A0A6A6Z199_9PEZI|nr:uncharacterized protein BDZ99DRAFT_494538 [Mytilinidion resinicola]KAF2814578.1 hypothetical protein BDZ99DRAFT_494538 [Mytilinidion resinicola]